MNRLNEMRRELDSLRRECEDLAVCAKLPAGVRAEFRELADQLQVVVAASDEDCATCGGSLAGLSEFEQDAHVACCGLCSKCGNHAVNLGGYVCDYCADAIAVDRELEMVTRVVDPEAYARQVGP